MGNGKKYSGCTIGARQCQCFDRLSVHEREYLDENTVTLKYKKGEVLLKQGSFASHVMSVEEGLVKVYIDDGLNSLVLKIISPGNLLGLSSVNEDQPTFQYSAKAYVDTVVKQINIDAFRKVVLENSEFAKGVINILSANSVQINGRFFCLTHKQSYGRLADIILCLSDRVFKEKEFELPLSRKDLAELSGLSAETVIRILKKFKDDSLIDMVGKGIKVMDYDRLKKISDAG